MKVAREQNQMMQRIKVGLIGLASVVLLIGIASAIIGAATRTPPAIANAGEPVVANLQLDNMATGEPLAELGATPGPVNEQVAANP